MNRTAAKNSLQHTIERKLQERNREKQQEILLMSHLVLGAPSLEENLKVIDAMVKNGVDIMELQIPFSEPVADGPVIAAANQSALDAGFSVEEGLQFIQKVTQRHDIPFLIMTYYNILFSQGEEAFIRRAAKLGVQGLIIPDLPLEMAENCMKICREENLAWVQLLTPTTPEKRLKKIADAGEGFTYCVARKGVTGLQTAFDEASPTSQFLQQCKKASPVPLAVGFGVSAPEDVRYLTGRCEIAVVGTKSIRIHQEEGTEAVGRFFAGLRT
ncbi:tryptophan synthase subunit alpha [Magnetococcales bacterium HHB-1]